METDYAHYRRLIEECVLRHVGNVLKQPRSFIRYPFMDPGPCMTAMSGSGISTG